jgi:hypothetical protein
MYFQANHNLVLSGVDGAGEPITLPLFAQVQMGDNGDFFTSGQWVAPANQDPGNGQDTVGLYRHNAGLTSTFFLADSNPAPATFDDKTPPPSMAPNFTSFGLGADIDAPIAGNWDGDTDGTDEVGLWRSANALFILASENSSAANLTFMNLGGPGDTPLTGNWDGGAGNDTDEIGVARSEAGLMTFYLRGNDGTIYVQQLGDGSDLPLAGDWNGDGNDTIGIYRPSDNTFYMTNQIATLQGTVGSVFLLAGGDPGDLPIVGGWAGNCPNN